MKPPTDGHTDYIQPSEASSVSLKSPLELLANACNKLETSMMSTVRSEPAKKLPSPSHSSHIPQLRLAPTRQSSEPLALVTRPPATSPTTVTATASVTSPTQSPEPLSLVSKPQPAHSPENLIKKPEPKGASPPVRPEIGSIRVRPAEALSPASLPPNKRMRESPSPRLKPPTSSPLPPPTSVPSLPPGFPPSLPSSLASLYSSPYMAALAGAPQPHSGGAPCTDPLCRDVTCPTYQLRAAQAAQMMAMTGLSLPPGYPYSFPPAPPLPGLPPLPPSMLGYPGAPPSLPALLPPSFLPSTVSPPGLLPPPVSVPTTSPVAPLSVGASPFSCNWVQGGSFCGRRFNSSEELMSHLRTHTANMGDSAGSGPGSALALLQAQAAQLRGSPTPPASSPQTLAPPPDLRYNPYIRPSLPSQNPSIPPMLASLYGSPRQLPVLP